MSLYREHVKSALNPMPSTKCMYDAQSFDLAPLLYHSPISWIWGYCFLVKADTDI